MQGAGKYHINLALRETMIERRRKEAEAIKTMSSTYICHIISLKFVVFYSSFFTLPTFSFKSKLFIVLVKTLYYQNAHMTILSIFHNRGIPISKIIVNRKLLKF